MALLQECLVAIKTLAPSGTRTLDIPCYPGGLFMRHYVWLIFAIFFLKVHCVSLVSALPSTVAQLWLQISVESMAYTAEAVIVAYFCCELL